MMTLGLSTIALVAAQLVAIPEVTLRFASDTVFLGEPVWVIVTAHNRTAFPQRWNPGYYCPAMGELPVTAVAPDAAPGPAKPAPCTYGRPGGNCMTALSMGELAPGDSASWRYLLMGDFHFERAGTYAVQLTTDPGKPGPLARGGPVDRGRSSTAAPPSVLAVTQTRTLVILPSDDAALLEREKRWAAEVETAESRRFETRPGRGTGAAAREARQRESDNVFWFRLGLAEHPVRGMEQVFERWLQISNVYEDDAIRGLKNLDTPASRAVLAQFARTPSKANSYTQDGAISALADLTDRQYYPLMVEALASPDERVRRHAVRGVGSLGGEIGVTKLLELARTSSDAVMVNDALSALGRAGSRTAVKGLIDLIATTEGGRGLLDAGGFPLFVLTHHRLPNLPRLRTADELHREWLEWWETIGRNARVYTQFECAPQQIRSRLSADQVNAWSSVRVTGGEDPHAYGINLDIWKGADTLVGYMSEYGGFIADPPIARLDSIRFNEQSGALSFSVRITAGAVPSSGATTTFVPAKWLYQFAGVVGDSAIMGTMRKTLLNTDSRAIVSSEQVVLRRVEPSQYEVEVHNTLEKWVAWREMLVRLRGSGHQLRPALFQSTLRYKV